MQQKSCCPPNSTPFLAENPNYVARGNMISYEEVSAYFVGNGTTAVIFIHDIYGLNSGMNKLICDTLADRLPGTIIIAPDFYPLGNLFGNDPLPERGMALFYKTLMRTILCCTICGHVQKYSWDNITGSTFNKTTEFLKFKHGCTKFALIGVCWGSYVGFKACNEAVDKNMIFCNISVHPSVHTLCPMYGDNATALVAGINCPQLLAPTKQEPSSWKPNGQVSQQIKQIATDRIGELSEFYDFSSENHGFFTRGDLSNEATREAVQDLHCKIVDFISKLR